MHFTPTSASWLSMVERFFLDLTTERLRRGLPTSSNGDKRARRLA